MDMHRTFTTAVISCKTFSRLILFNMNQDSIYQDEFPSFNSSRRTGIFQWAEQCDLPQRASLIYPPAVFTTGEDYMPAYPELDISSYSGLSCNYPPPSPVYLTIPEGANESLWWGTPMPVSPGRSTSVANDTLCWGTPIPVSPGGARSDANDTLSWGTPIPVSPGGERHEEVPRVWRPWECAPHVALAELRPSPIAASPLAASPLAASTKV